MNRCIFLHLLAFGVAGPASGQTTEDSIKLHVESSKGLARAEALYRAVTFYVKKDLDVAQTYVDATTALATRNNDPMIRAYVYLNQGVFYTASGRTDSAVVLIEKGFNIGSEQADERFLIQAGLNLGRAYIAQGNAEKALSNLFHSLQLLDKHSDRESELKVRIAITWAYLELKRYRDCVHYGRQTMAMITDHFHYMLPVLCNNMAASYGAMDNLDSARILLTIGIPIAEANDDYTIVANGLFLLGDVYRANGQYNQAIAQFEKARKYREKIANPFFIVSDLAALCNLYYQSGEYQKGVRVGLEALDIANKSKIILKFEDIYDELAANYEALGDFKNSSHFYSLLAYAKDTIYQNATADAITEMQAKYEGETKDRKIKDLSTSNAFQAAVIERNYTFIGGLVLIIALLTLVFLMWRNRNKQKQQAVLQEQKIRYRESQINAVIDSEERERRRLAQDLHDGMGQLVTALQLNIQSIKQNNDLAQQVSLVENSERLLTDIHAEIRNVAFNLMPVVLLKEGLVPAVRELIRKINASGTITATVSVYGINDRFPNLVEISVYRILQELISNIVQYARATTIRIAFTGQADDINITLEDNGQGFDVEQFRKNEKGNGWSNIQSRIHLIHGQIEFDSVPGRPNTTVIIDIPVTVEKSGINSGTDNQYTQ